MVGFCRCIFYLTFSLVLASAYFFAMDYFKKIEERKARLDEYYIDKFETAYFLLLEKEEFVRDEGREKLIETEKQAYSDGYYKADVEIMKTNAYRKEYWAQEKRKES